MKIEVKVIAPKKGALERQAWDAVKAQLMEHLENRLSNVQCAEHHQRPRVTIVGSLKNPRFQIEGCCQQVVKEASEAIK